MSMEDKWPEAATGKNTTTKRTTLGQIEEMINLTTAQLNEAASILESYARVMGIDSPYLRSRDDSAGDAPVPPSYIDRVHCLAANQLTAAMTLRDACALLTERLPL